MTERFEICKDGRIFCLWEIAVSYDGDICLATNTVERLISDVRAGVSDHVSAYTLNAEESVYVGRRNIVPYRYRFFADACDLDCDLLFMRILSSFDARFPGGSHTKMSIGVVYDVKAERYLRPSFTLLSDISKKERKKLGEPLSFGLSNEGLRLICTGGEYCFDTKLFCKNYKTIRDLTCKFDKKPIDKRGNI